MSLHFCQNCNWSGADQALLPIVDINERVAPGEAMPSGECPLCRSLAHEADPFAGTLIYQIYETNDQEMKPYVPDVFRTLQQATQFVQTLDNVDCYVYLMFQPANGGMQQFLIEYYDGQYNDSLRGSFEEAAWLAIDHFLAPGVNDPQSDNQVTFSYTIAGDKTLYLRTIPVPRNTKTDQFIDDYLNFYNEMLDTFDYDLGEVTIVQANADQQHVPNDSTQVTFEFEKQQIIESYTASLAIPNSVIDKGSKFIHNYIFGNYPECKLINKATQNSGVFIQGSVRVTDIES